MHLLPPSFLPSVAITFSMAERGRTMFMMASLKRSINWVMASMGAMEISVKLMLSMPKAVRLLKALAEALT